MKAAKKIIKINELLTIVNNMLATSPSDAKEERSGMIAVIETVLISTNNYKGFKYLMKTQLQFGSLPGINVDDNGEICEDAQARFANTDYTRVQYF